MTSAGRTTRRVASCAPPAGASVEPVALAALEYADHRTHRVIVRWLEVTGLGLDDDHRRRVVFEQGPVMAEQQSATAAGVNRIERRQGDDAGGERPDRIPHHRPRRGDRVARHGRVPALAHELPGIEGRRHDEAPLFDRGIQGLHPRRTRLGGRPPPAECIRLVGSGLGTSGRRESVTGARAPDATSSRCP